MKNDLSRFEKDLIVSINMLNATKYTWKNLMEWNSDKKTVETKLQDDELMYEVAGFYVAMKKMN